MSANENLAVARQLDEAFNRNDLQAAGDLIADDVIWHEIGREEPRVGKAALAAAGPGAVDYEIKGETHDVLASEDHVISLVNATATRGGKTFHYRTAEILHVKDGKVTERWAFSDDTAAIAAFFG